MCGIAGILNLTTARQPDAVSLVERMSHLLHHRGPDDSGLYRAPGDKLVMANRRLAVLDLSDEGHMPMPNERGDIWLSFNGEIYNFREVRHSLKLCGHVFRSQSDSEVVVHAYEQYGLDFTDHLRGMFAIALWDDRFGRLVLARDRLGKKPLYYTRHGDFLAFASEIKALTAAMPFRRRLDPWALSQYLTYGFVMPPRTMFEGVHKLAAGEALVIERGGPPERRSWWQPCRDSRKAGIIRGLTADQHVANLRTLMESSVADRLVSDVPFGAILNEGLASSCVVAVMGRLISRPVEAVAVVDPRMAGPGGSSTRKLAQQLGVRYHEVTVTTERALGYLSEYVRHLDEPISEPAIMPAWWAAKFCRDNGLSVALAGDGAEATLLQYPSYAGLRRRTMLRRLLGGLAPRFLGGDGRPAGRRRGSQVGGNVFLGSESVFAESDKWSLLGQPMRELLRGRAAEAETSRILGEMPAWLGDDSLAAASYFEVRMRLAEKQLMRLDKMAMAHGVEIRTPLLDDQLVDYVLAIPGDLRAAGRWSNPLLGQAVANLLPVSLLKSLRTPAPPGGLGLGDGEAMAGVFEDCLRKSRLFGDGVLDGRRCQALLRDHRDGRPVADKLWNILLLAEWYDLFWVEGPAGEAAAPARDALRLGRPQAAG